MDPERSVFCLSVKHIVVSSVNARHLSKLRECTGALEQTNAVASFPTARIIQLFAKAIG